ncbi:DUF2911 domain-containing protein [Psychroserpens algicola]|uniref:DUF2911 domain-containing protein n=1 Tax=Psychroserpens algicola TaxID=1719034 RepID=A0ABT0H5Z2_9FLAO|nr:DUF2911 domain-containing protein [Psychroserpens algicola]MCK8479771.1 DUF2911 domain-containing protein [Psychroserpens algicola]
MKIITLIFTIVCIGTSAVNAQEIKGIDQSPLDFAVFRPGSQESYPVARIIYSRPQKKGRNIFGELVPFGKIWRTGANQSTELNLYKDISFEGKKLKKGSYTIYTIPNEKEWTIIINSKLFTWGHFDYDESKDVMRFNVPLNKSVVEREYFGIAFTGKDGKGSLLMAWDSTEIYINFEY